MNSDQKMPHVLIVDDTQKNIQVLGALLKKQNYQISVAMNGLQALKQVMRVKPDLILLDVMMPEMDGFETIRNLKADPGTKDIPVIFLTAKVDIEDIVKGFEMGAIDYVTKPFNHTELLSRVNTHLQLQMAREKIVAFAKEMKEWNDKLEEKLDDKTLEINDMNKTLLQKTKVLESRDRILEFILEVHQIEESVEFILNEIVGLVNFEKIIVYSSHEENGNYRPHFGINGLDDKKMLSESELSKYPELPRMDQTELELICKNQVIDVQMINEYSGFLPLIKESKLTGYLLMDNSKNSENLKEADLVLARDFAPLLAIVEHDWSVLNSSEDMDNTISDILDEISD